MSDTEGTGSGSDGQEPYEFKCRKCPGKKFTAAEKDAHRMFHRELKDKEKKRPGPKSKTTRHSTRRNASPAPSEITLFEPVTSSQSQADTGKQTTRGGKRKKKDKEPHPEPKRNKRKSKKNYDTGVIGEWSNGTGA